MVNQPTALIRRPSPRLDEGLVTHIERTRVDYELALKQWANYVEALRLCKWNIVEVPAADDYPDSVFIEDTVVMYKGTAIITRPGSDSRKPEIIAVEKVVTELGHPIARISEPQPLTAAMSLKLTTPFMSVMADAPISKELPNSLRLSNPWAQKWSLFRSQRYFTSSRPLPLCLRVKSSGLNHLSMIRPSSLTSLRFPKNQVRMWSSLAKSDCSWPQTPQKLPRLCAIWVTSSLKLISASSSNLKVVLLVCRCVSVEIAQFTNHVVKNQ